MASTNDFLTKLADLLEVDPGEVKQDQTLDALGWNSLAAVGFIAMVDEEYGVSVSPSRLAKCERPNDMIAMLGEQVAWEG